MTEVVMALAVMFVVLQAALFVFFFTVPKNPRVALWLHLPSLVIAWGGYMAYEGLYVRSHCTGECNIRVDLLLIFPYLASVTICAITYFARRPRGR